MNRHPSGDITRICAKDDIRWTITKVLLRTQDGLDGFFC
jgi:hypothetical protein